MSVHLSRTKTKNFRSPLLPTSLLDEKKALTAVVEDPRQFTRGFNLFADDITFIVITIMSAILAHWLAGFIAAGVVVATLIVAPLISMGTVLRRKRAARERLAVISNTIAREWVIRAPKSVVPQVRDFLKAIETLPAEHRSDFDPMIRAVTDDCILLRSLEDATTSTSPCCNPEILNARKRIADRSAFAQAASREALALEEALRQQDILSARGIIDTSDIDEAAGVVEMLRASRTAVEDANDRATVSA